MSGPNYLLDKGYLVDAAATNVEHGRFVKFLPADTTGKKVTTATAPAAPAVAAGFCVGVWQDTIDAAKIATGKCVTNVRMMGISRVRAGAAVTIGAAVTSDANGKAIPVPAGTNDRHQYGIALSPAAADGDYFNCLLTPGAKTNGGVT
jgi:hypothetical protein